MKFQKTTTTTFVIEAWADVPEGRDPEEFAEHLRSLGNEVRQYDEDNRRWRLAFDVEQQEG